MSAFAPSPIHRLASTSLAFAKVIAVGGLLPIAVVGLIALVL